MIKLSLAAAGFAAVMLMATAPGYCGGSVGCTQDLNCRAAATNSAQTGRIETVNFAAAGLLRQIVDASPKVAK